MPVQGSEKEKSDSKVMGINLKKKHNPKIITVDLSDVSISTIEVLYNKKWHKVEFPMDKRIILTNKDGDPFFFVRDDGSLDILTEEYVKESSHNEKKRFKRRSLHVFDAKKYIRVKTEKVKVGNEIYDVPYCEKKIIIEEQKNLYSRIKALFAIGIETPQFVSDESIKEISTQFGCTLNLIRGKKKVAKKPLEEQNKQPSKNTKKDFVY